MQEIFHEETAVVQEEAKEKRKYNLLNTLSIICYVLAPLTLIISLGSINCESPNALIGLIIMLIPVAIYLAVGIFFGKKKNNYLVDYDYTYISGSIRISKVLRGVKRRFIIEFEDGEIEKIGKYGSETYSRYSNMSLSQQILTSNEIAESGKDFYYFVINSGGEKQLLILELTEKFIGTILKRKNSSLLDDEYIKELRQKKQ